MPLQRGRAMVVTPRRNNNYEAYVGERGELVRIIDAFGVLQSLHLHDHHSPVGLTLGSTAVYEESSDGIVGRGGMLQWAKGGATNDWVYHVYKQDTSNKKFYTIIPKEVEYMKHDDVSSKANFLNNIHTNFVPQGTKTFTGTATIQFANSNNCFEELEPVSANGVIVIRYRTSKDPLGSETNPVQNFFEFVDPLETDWYWMGEEYEPNQYWIEDSRVANGWMLISSHQSEPAPITNYQAQNGYFEASSADEQWQFIL